MRLRPPRSTRTDTLVPTRRSSDLLDSFDLSHRSVRMGAGRVLSGMAAGLLMISTVVEAETITYTYDAKGRLPKVKRPGTVNNKVTIDYENDKPTNHNRRKVTNSTNPPPQVPFPRLRNKPGCKRMSGRKR